MLKYVLVGFLILGCESVIEWLRLTFHDGQLGHCSRFLELDSLAALADVPLEEHCTKDTCLRQSSDGKVASTYLARSLRVRV